MATVNLGSIKFNWKGAYSGATAYVVDDVVESGGSTYVCILASTGNTPPNATYWELMSQAGTNGTDGTDLTTTLTTQGDIVYRNASGLARLGAGTNGQALLTGGAGANPSWGDVSSNVDLISYSALDATGVSNITTTTDWSTNNYYKIEQTIQYFSTTSTYFRFRNSSGDISSDVYAFMGYQAYDLTNHTDSTLVIHRDLDGARTELPINNWGGNTGFVAQNAKIEVLKPDVNGRQSVRIDFLTYDGNPYFTHNYLMSWTTDTSTKTGWNIYDGGASNLKNGFVVTYGYKYQ